MKKVALALAFCAAFVAVVPEANAVVCARGVYRAGCAGPNGAVGVRRAPAAVYRRPVGAVRVVR